jgi:hypothetical protein
LPPGLKRSSDPPITTMLSGFISFSLIITVCNIEAMNYKIQITFQTQPTDLQTF